MATLVWELRQHCCGVHAGKHFAYMMALDRASSRYLAFRLRCWLLLGVDRAFCCRVRFANCRTSSCRLKCTCIDIQLYGEPFVHEVLGRLAYAYLKVFERKYF